MALPLEFYETFEAGTKGDFTSETDTGNRLDFPHALDLAPLTPYRGAYCCRVNLGKNSSDAYVEEAVTWASSSIRYGRFRILAAQDVQFGNDRDYVDILAFYSSTSTLEHTLRLGRIDPYRVCVAACNADNANWTGDASYIVLPVGEWTTLEFGVYVDSAGGTTTVMRPGIARMQSVGSSEGTITKFRLGSPAQNGDIQGTILFDDFAVDESPLYEDDSAHNGALSGGSMFFLQSGFAFLGMGEIEHISLADGGSGNCRIKIYDTDNPNSLPLGALRENLATLTANATEQSRHRGFRCRRGAYIALSGTNPQAIVRLGAVASDHT